MNAAPEAPSPETVAHRSIRSGLMALCLSLWLLPLGFRVAALPFALGLVLLWGHARRVTLPGGRWWLIFAGVSLAVTPWVPYPQVHLAALTATYLMWVAYAYLLVALPLASNDLRLLQRSVAVTGAGLAAIGLANRLGLAFDWRWGGTAAEPWLSFSLSEGYRVASGIGMNPNILAACLLLTWPLTLDETTRQTGWRRWLWFGATLLQWVTLLLTQSRGAVVALLIVVPTWAWRRREVCRGLWGLGLALGIVVLATWSAWSSLGARLMTVIDATHSSNAVRLSLWQSGWAMMVDRPLTGVGVGAFTLAYPPYRHPQDIYNSDHLHDWYLQVVVESGWPAACCFFAGVWGVVREAQRRRHPAAEATLGFAVFGLADYLFHDPRVLMLIGTIWALGVAPAAARAPSSGRLLGEGSVPESSRPANLSG